MTKKALFCLTLATTATLLANEAADTIPVNSGFEFHGYFRAGLGINGDGDAMEAFEAGADYTNQENGPEGVLGKFTLAPQIQPGRGHFSRPAIRAFVTYAVWSGSDDFENSVAPVSYGTDTQGLSFGVQMEAWWESTAFPTLEGKAPTEPYLFRNQTVARADRFRSIMAHRELSSQSHIMPDIQQKKRPETGRFFYSND